MTREKILSVVAACRRRIGSVESVRQPANGMIPTYDVCFRHATWMCDQIEIFVSENRLDKANRWIGFIQGILWVTGRATIDQMREDNRD
jgi:hypothetical protein